MMEKLTKDQIDNIVTWLNDWDQLKNTSIPIRFKEFYSRDPLDYDCLKNPIFYGDEYFVVSPSFSIMPFRAYFPHNYPLYQVGIIYKNLEDAEKYVEDNKVKVIDLYSSISEDDVVTAKIKHNYILSLSKQIEGKSNSAAKSAIEKALNNL